MKIRIDQALLERFGRDARWSGDTKLKSLATQARRVSTQLQKSRDDFDSLLSPTDLAALSEAAAVMGRLAAGATVARKGAVKLKRDEDARRAEEQRLEDERVLALSEQLYGSVPDDDVRQLYGELVAFYNLTKLTEADASFVKYLVRHVGIPMQHELRICVYTSYTDQLETFLRDVPSMRLELTKSLPKLHVRFDDDRQYELFGAAAKQVFEEWMRLRALKAPGALA